MKVEYRFPHNPTELRDALTCSHQALGLGESDVQRALNYLNTDQWYSPTDTRVCFLDGKTVSSAHICNRPVRIEDCVVQMGGLSAVGTDANHRRAGYSSNVVRDCVAYMQQNGYDFSVLFTGVQSHYARVGWVIYPTYTMHLRLPESPAGVPDGVTIEPCNVNRDAQALAEIYDSFNATRTGTLVRNLEYWKNHSIWWENDSPFFWVARQGGRITAYLQASRWDVRDFGYLPDGERAMDGLFCHLFHQAKTEDVNRIDAPVPSEYREIFESLGCTMQRREHNSMMMRIIDLPSLFSKIRPCLEKRLRASNLSAWVGSICLRYEAGSVTLHIKNGRLEISRQGAESMLELVMSQEQLLKLLFGNITGSQIAFANGLTLNTSEMDLLHVLFPPGEFFLWGADHF